MEVGYLKGKTFEKAWSINLEQLPFHIKSSENLNVLKSLMKTLMATRVITQFAQSKYFIYSDFLL